MFNNPDLERQYLRLTNLIRNTRDSFEPDDELQSHLAKYLCILCSGFLENALKITLSDFAEQRTGDEMILSYLKSQLQRINNPNSGKIRDTTKIFSPILEERLNTFMQVNDKSSAINYIIKDRHKIAHGKDSDITIRKIEEYFTKVVKVFVFIEQDLLTNARA
ncbi:conserved hypothetical protein [Tenacibaculum sediminilitoris]|uniref:HEPN domain-containing protein n=1 Tax=Tenacibaculum sediminilitoris TaxID=1820334 RepID=UPI003894E328